ncbi:MAG TPA: 50S ribosomal protein L10 [Nitrospirae bacterium]|nr:50S ribosomal protein L10 [Nitrospirota bacterium]HDZ02702.1 50S ribosomal protein L10 [Nitrospirota bacterium]
MKELKKEEKIKVVSELQGKFERAKGVVFTDYRGLNVEEITELRNNLRSAALDYRVVKNTLAKRAAEGTPVNDAADIFSGPVGIAIGYDDPVLLVKKVLEFSKSNKKLGIRGGVIEGGVCSPEQIRTISELPPREVQLSMLVGAMQAPLSKFAGLLNSTLSQFIYALEALKNKKGES